MIKKFKNGNVTITSPYFSPKNTINRDIYTNKIDNFYDNEITMNDLYLNQINGYMYLVDFNTGYVLDFDRRYFTSDSNFLLQIDEYLEKNRSLKLYAYNKKESKSLLQDLENGY